MIDCPNAEIRDRLPDLVHERLDSATRALVLAHVGSCEACREELVLLRTLRDGMSRGPSLDVNAIARAVIARTVEGQRAASAAPTSVRPSRSRLRWTDWRVAAAVTMLVVGGASVATVRLIDRGHIEADTGLPVAVPPRGDAVDSGADVRRSTRTPEAVPAAAELSMGGGVADLSESDLRDLLADIEALDAVPEPEPEPVAVRVSLPGSRE